MKTNNRSTDDDDLRSVIPNPHQSLESFERFTHRDIATLTDVEVREQVAAWLAQVVFQRQRPRYVHLGSDFITDQAWARQRLTRLRQRLDARAA
jgi:hypothetical protein